MLRRRVGRTRSPLTARPQWHLFSPVSGAAEGRRQQCERFLSKAFGGLRPSLSSPRPGPTGKQTAEGSPTTTYCTVTEVNIGVTHSLFLRASQ